MFEIVLRKDAQLDLDEIFVWYEEQKEGLGFEFIDSFEKVLNKIVSNPYYASFILEDARGVSLKRFPYEVIYRVDESLRQVRIIAVIHQHRNPEWFRNRISK
jgi:plasmid stabilization system protein ParE